HYIAPEIYTRDVYDKPVDIWALGCVLFELMELEKAFAGPESIVRQKIMNASWPPIKIKRNPDLEEILDKCRAPTVDLRATTTHLLFMAPVLMAIAKLCSITDVRDEDD
uniref:Protein kinase domain-containing protein n=1 Tax=Panagrolaimus sp. JU765 TaxID=591449 RepID=A0AC34QHI3_9BILA